jgi:beta-phosphoglucomutase family hydrolase
MEIKAVLFDMDGVICHTNPYHSEAFRIFFEKRNIRTTEEDFVDHLYGKSNSYIFKHFLKEEYRNNDFAQLEDEKEMLFRQLYRSKIEPLPGLMKMLDWIKERKIKSGLATSAPKANMQMIMEKLDLYNYMGSHLASEDILHHKPDPEIYLKTADILDVKPRDCLVFEDSFSGVTAARSAGMQVIGVLTTHKQNELPECKMYISDFKEALSFPFLR